MLASVKYLGDLAAAAVLPVTIPVPSGARAIEVHVAATAAVSGTFQVSHDGVTFVASNLPSISASAGADGSVLVSLNDSPYKLDGGPVGALKLTLTAGAGAASVVVLTEDQVKLGR